jgi:polysaccharide biosynthesis/export protein
MTRLVAITIALAIIAGACTNGPNSRYEDFGNRANPEGFGHRYAQPDNEDELVMAPGDTIQVQIARNPELSTIQEIRYEGVIQMAYIGDVKVAGLTPTQIRDKLTVLMTPFIQGVSIEVAPLAITSKNVYLFSTDQFDNIIARVFPVQGDMTLIDLFAQLGAVPDGTDDEHVRLIRGDPRHPDVLNINFRDMVSAGRTAANVQLKPDDMIWLPSNFLYRVTQAVNRVTRPLQQIQRPLISIDQIRSFIENGRLQNQGVFVQ